MGGTAAQDEHAALVARFEARVAELSGYSLREAAAYERPPVRDAAWLERWAGGGGSRGVLVL